MKVYGSGVKRSSRGSSKRGEHRPENYTIKTLTLAFSIGSREISFLATKLHVHYR